MKLTKTEHIKVYLVQADYKKEINNKFFIAILKFAHEHNGFLTPDMLESLFPHLPEAGCRNLLQRLSALDYFQAFDDDFELTDFGIKAAQQESYFDSRKGLLKIYVAHNEFLGDQIVKIEESEKEKGQDDPFNIRMAPELLKAKNTLLHLNHKYYLEDFEENISALSPVQESMSIEEQGEKAVLSLMDYNAELQSYDNFKEVMNELLQNEFGSAYMLSKQLLKIPFNPYDLSFKQKKAIGEPVVLNTVFDSLSLQLKVIPENLQHAQRWYEALVKAGLNKHFIEEEDFVKFENECWQKLSRYYPIESVSKQDWIKKLEKNASAEAFYQASRLSTIDYLNY